MLERERDSGLEIDRVTRKRIENREERREKGWRFVSCVACQVPSAKQRQSNSNCKATLLL